MDPTRAEVKIADQPEKWGSISPQKLIAELQTPGRTDLPPILPVIGPSHPEPANRMGPLDLDNFHLLLPGHREIQHAVLFHDTLSVGQVLLKFFQEGGGLRYLYFGGHSLKYLHQTATSFFAAIDQAIQECGTSMQEIAALMPQNNSRCEDKLRAWLKTHGPAVYWRLRDAGYSHSDLTR